MNTYINFLCVVFALFLNGCWQGQSFMQQKDLAGATFLSVPISTSGSGVVAKISAHSDVTQVVSSPASSSIAGASMSIPPGALALDTDLTITPGLSIATASFASSLGLQSNPMSSAGTAVVFSSSVSQNSSVPMTLALPYSGSNNLALDSDVQSRTIVVFRYWDATTGVIKSGLWGPDHFTISGSTLSLSTNYFGVYQAAVTQTVVSGAVASVVSNTPILSTDQANALPPVNWNPVPSVTLQNGGQSMTVKVSTSGLDPNSNCVLVAVNNQNDTTPRHTCRMRSVSDMTSYLLPICDASASAADKARVQADCDHNTDTTATSFYMQFICDLPSGQEASSKFSNQFAIDPSVCKAATASTAAFTPVQFATLSPTGTTNGGLELGVSFTGQINPKTICPNGISVSDKYGRGIPLGVLPLTDPNQQSFNFISSGYPNIYGPASCGMMSSLPSPLVEIPYPLNASFNLSIQPSMLDTTAHSVVPKTVSFTTNDGKWPSTANLAISFPANFTSWTWLSANAGNDGNFYVLYTAEDSTNSNSSQLYLLIYNPANGSIVWEQVLVTEIPSANPPTSGFVFTDANGLVNILYSVNALKIIYATQRNNSAWGSSGAYSTPVSLYSGSNTFQIGPKFVHNPASQTVGLAWIEYSGTYYPKYCPIADSNLMTANACATPAGTTSSAGSNIIPLIANNGSMWALLQDSSATFIIQKNANTISMYQNGSSISSAPFTDFDASVGPDGTIFVGAGNTSSTAQFCTIDTTTTPSCTFNPLTSSSTYHNGIRARAIGTGAFFGWMDSTGFPNAVILSGGNLSSPQVWSSLTGLTSYEIFGDLEGNAMAFVSAYNAGSYNFFPLRYANGQGFQNTTSLLDNATSGTINAVSDPAGRVYFMVNSATQVRIWVYQ